MVAKLDDLITAKEAAVILKVTPCTVRTLCSNGEIPAVKHGWQWFIVRGDLKGIIGRKRGRPSKQV
jgi:excisionase family DNA binding protein